jgi:phosphoglucosamine mutase
MKPEKVFKRYDIRGKYPEELNEEFAKKLGKALGTFTERNYSTKIVVSRDNKDTSEPLKESLIEGLRSTGSEVIDAGIGPTDYAAFAGKRQECISVQVTSSHMPLEFNGFKFMYPEGNGFVNEDLNTVKDIFRSEEFSEGSGSTRSLEDNIKESYKREIKQVAGNLGSESLDLTVAVDTLGGATTGLLPSLLEEIGADVIDISERYEEHPYRDPPNPKPEHLSELKKTVEDTEADLGLATDMDGDRVAVFTDRFITGDEIFNILAQKVEGDAVASIDTSNALEDLLRKRGDHVYYTRVGDPFVMDKALDESVALAGEPNGHYSLLEFVPYNSGTLTALILAGTNISESLQRKPDYSVDRSSFKTEEKHDKMERIKRTVKQSYNFKSEIDGVKFEADGIEVLVRPSGSSPKIRVIAESEDEQKLEKNLGRIKGKIEDA